MSEFKYACPVCGQHMMCDSTQSGTTMECPTCFQKIVAPQAPSTDDPKFIITGTKVGERPPPRVAAEIRVEVSSEKKSPLGTIMAGAIVLALIGAGAVLVMHWHGKASPPVKATIRENRPAAGTTPGSQLNQASSAKWTLDLNSVAIPDSPVAGLIHSKVLDPQTILVNADGLTIRTADLPPEAGVTIYLREKPQNFFGKTVVVEPNTTNPPMVNLRWKDGQGQAMNQQERRYAMRIEFGQPAGGQLPGKIYLCTPDEQKSYVVGTFTAQIH